MLEVRYSLEDLPLSMHSVMTMKETAFWSLRVKNASDLRSHLKITSLPKQRDPLCRFL